jgi:hypothetical protein
LASASNLTTPAVWFLRDLIPLSGKSVATTCILQVIAFVLLPKPKIHLLMKKLIVLTSALVITGAIAQAQKTTFGIKGGIQQSSLSLKATDGDVKISVDGSKIGAIAGGVADIQFTDKFSVQPNLLFVYKPGTMLFLGEGDVTTMSVDVPIDLLYHSNGFFIGAGPNFSYGLSSKYKPFDNTQDDVDLYKAEGSNNAPFKRFEFGANAVMGFQFPSGLTITTNYTRGFNNIADKDAIGENTTFNTKQFGVSIGYLFNSKKAKK